MLRAVCAAAAKSFAALLFADLPTLPGNGCWSEGGAGDRGGFNPDILIWLPDSAYSHAVDATRVTSARPVLGAFARAPRGAVAALIGVAGGQQAEVQIVVVTVEGPADRYGVIDGYKRMPRCNRWGGTRWKRWCGRAKPRPCCWIARSAFPNKDRAEGRLAATGDGAAFRLQPGRKLPAS
jgi:hypothetical protein